ncbi:putative Late nodulin [Medicago truncatula]|uniref:Nodule Cysteine-Rich (NCR) secreted peptide n=1 Tax=Medicago truncatula TaxID=3880 RepID=A0A072UKI9_MEDTR|nr:Nodule Cysteine-Rich (NCR) secreted peptide [Medicago truncatula]RHN60551.1 putative Late nodulin [Medicago truncatula]
MVKVFKFTYLMIIFFSLFLVAMNVDAVIECNQHSDCPKDMCQFHLKPNCILMKVRLSNFFPNFYDGICGCD